jgi:MarR family transcriptional regulator, 2-MHQ and catechol-resistance regulon repressor
MPNDIESPLTKATRSAVAGKPVARPAEELDADPLHGTAVRYHTEFPWADQDAIEIALSLFRANRILGTGLARYLDGLGLGISRARYTVLRTLYFAKGNRMPQNEIGREMGVSKTNVTNLIDGLEKDGLVVRITNPADRRVTYAQLTPEGEELSAALMPEMTKFMQDVVHGFTTEEKTLFREFLFRVWRGVTGGKNLDETASDSTS